MKFTEKVEKLPKQTYKITVSIPWSEIEESKEEALKELTLTTEVEGFRKGKAPAKLVREKLGEERLLDEGIRHLLSHIYVDVLKKHDIKPYIDPKVSLLDAKEKTEWHVLFEVAEAPVLTKLADYKAIAEKLKGEAKKDEIWVPGKDAAKDQKPEDVEKKKNEKLQRVFNDVVEQSDIEISPLILDEETNRRLVSMYDEIKKLGMTVEQYLAARKETAESIRAKAAKEVTDMYKSEFVLDKIADEAKITVEEKELEPVYKTAKTDKDKEELKQNAYFYTRLIRKQKTLDFLTNL
ncbi:MAG: trigger factor [Patescibacteria group bacterium]|jgi:FKBP-type peptidyl-prolyl cis-trans isomerase (trigger factor)